MSLVTTPHVFQAVAAAIIAEEEKENPLINREETAVAVQDILISYSDSGLATKEATTVPYSEPAHRWAYTYLYLTSHVHMVYNCFKDFYEQTAFLHDWYLNSVEDLGLKSVGVCSVGGGPGADLLGLSLAFKDFDFKPHIRGTILDLWINWSENLNGVVHQLNATENVVSLHAEYEQFEFFTATSDEWNTWSMKAVQSADMVTMVKFLSAVAYNQGECQKTLAAILRQMKPGALLFVLDNAGGGYGDMLKRAAIPAGLTILGEITHASVTIPDYEKTDMNTSSVRLGMSPQRTSKVSAFLYKKESLLGVPGFAFPSTPPSSFEDIATPSYTPVLPQPMTFASSPIMTSRNAAASNTSFDGAEQFDWSKWM